MKTTTIALSLAAMFAVPVLAHAEDMKKPASQAKPDSSAAATPDSKKHSAGTVGAMKKAGEGSFTASDADKKKDLMKK